MADVEELDRPVQRRRLATLAFIGLALAGAIIALGAFQPWQQFLDDEGALPFPGTRAFADDVRDTLAQSAKSDREGHDPLDQPLVHELGTGSLEGRDGHTAAGTARVLELTDGRRIVRLEGLDLPNGPDLKVYLSPSPADAPTPEFAQAAVSLGDLAYNVGDSNYEIPPDVDPRAFRSVSIWSESYGVNFAVAPIR